MDDDGFEMGPVACLAACAVIAVILAIDTLVRHRVRIVQAVCAMAGFAVGWWLV